MMSTSQSLVSATLVSFIQVPNITKFLFVKLTSTNYLLSEAQILPLLYGYRFSGYIDRSCLVPL